jgi:hypothetical protein
MEAVMAKQTRLNNWSNTEKKDIAKYIFSIVLLSSAFFTSCSEQSTSPQVNKPTYYCQYNGYTYSNYNDYQATCIAPASSATETFYCQYNGYTYSNKSDFLATCIAPPTYYCETNGITYSDYSSYLALCTKNITSSSSLEKPSSSSKQFICNIPQCSSMNDCYGDAVRKAIKNNPHAADYVIYLEAAHECNCANTQCSKSTCYGNSEKSLSTIEEKCELQYECACYK